MAGKKNTREIFGPIIIHFQNYQELSIFTKIKIPKKIMKTKIKSIISFDEKIKNLNHLLKN